MRRKLLLVLAIVVVLTATATAPATAQRGVVVGETDLTLYLHECPGEGTDPGDVVSWTGTIDIGDKVWGIAYLNPVLTPIGDEGWMYFEEEWKLFWLGKKPHTEKRLLRAACNPNRMFVKGVDSGVGTPEGTWLGMGEVLEARPFLDHFVGGEVLWKGELTAPDKFASTLVMLPA